MGENQTSSRKLDHIRICVEEDVESEYTGLEDVMLLHNSLPELDLADIITEVRFLGSKLSAPLLIASMTGGHPDTKDINRNLAMAVEETGIGMGVGSQRAAIEDKSLEDTFSIVREHAGNAFIYANIGIPQIIKHGVEYAEKAVEMIDADALAIHLNYMQEVVQPEGDVYARNGYSAIENVVKEIKVPVIVKETGGGISNRVARKLRNCGVEAVDVGGAGGTSWTAVEFYRTKDDIGKRIAIDFWDWGIPTSFSIIECAEILPVIATGGLRSGLDVAKCIALGAEIGSSALPFLHAAMRSSDEVVKEINYFIKGLKVAMFLTGSRRVKDLRDCRIVVSGKLKEYIEVTGIDVVKFCESRNKGGFL
ncbi:isopentenyl-diphosphate delta-isomerase [Archaeoglobus sulfaticallidus PM70-1]|uniref:Isopentenyl-diphosphate delta-isomerase n=1 Tax=Archaeoglobus sulfaticallidus PM70-1 TaxID=387631 RepID=N0BJC3_9EURY|nr:type 2 isopentenyl-diphosphate Delta-isomerase [Archaeoglobus sulfaticallidus]AGK60556.1 isopentenyl-diphosphate delta-isomerase [Archaeoglobus sulfaticallidus PM70-1]